MAISLTEGTVLAAIAAIPGLLASWTRRKALSDRGEVSRFNAIFDAQTKLVDECKERCNKLEEEITSIRAEHRLEIQAIRDKHRREIEDFEKRHAHEIQGWEAKYLALEGNFAGLQERILYLESLLDRISRRSDPRRGDKGGERAG